MDADCSTTRTIGGIDLEQTLRFPAILMRDPTVRLGPGRFERATLTPDGPASVCISWEPSDRSAQAVAKVDAWGPGAPWILERIDGLLGLEDDVTNFDPAEGPLRTVWERMSRARIPRTNTVWHDLAWFILQQRVRFIDAANAWHALVTALGEPAPGPVELLAPPTPDAIRALPYDRFHPFGIERSRAETLIRTAREMSRIEKLVDGPFDAARVRLQAIRGVGPWTLGGLESLTWGSADAVIVGDVGLPQLIGWWLARDEWADDDRMLELLEPHRPHRYRIIQLAFASGASVPRRRPTRYGTNDIRRR